VPTFENVETGELHLVAFAKRRLHKEPFVMLFQAALRELIVGDGRVMSSLHWKLYLYLISACGYGNKVEITIKDLAAAVGYDRSSVSRALPILEGLGLIHRDARRGNLPRRIWIHPEVAFRGKAAQLDAMLDRGWPPRSEAEALGEDGTTSTP
jgi:DNA-binding MarR family transcriptional regulator